MTKPLELPDEYLKAIGDVIVRWNQLEQIMNLFLIYLLGKEIHELRSHIVVAHMSFPQKLDILGSLAEEVMKNPAYSSLKKYKATVQPLLKQAQSGRNMVIHSPWSMKSGKVMRASISARGSFKFSWKVGTLDEIVGVTRAIEDAGRELSDLANPAWMGGIDRKKKS